MDEKMTKDQADEMIELMRRQEKHQADVRNVVLVLLIVGLVVVLGVTFAAQSSKF